MFINITKTPKHYLPPFRFYCVLKGFIHALFTHLISLNNFPSFLVIDDGWIADLDNKIVEYRII